MTTRRQLLAAASTLWLTRALAAAEALPPAPGGDLRRRLARVDALTRALRHGEVSQTAWQDGVEAELRQVDLPALCAAADFERVRARLPLLPRGTSAEVVHLVPGQAFTPKVFAIGPGRAIVPHGHSNMVSHHLVLSGVLRGRHYQRLRDEPGHLIVRPTIDRTFRPGDTSSISDQRDNVHWFIAQGPAYTLDCILDNLDPSRPERYQIDFVDPERAVPSEDGALRMPRLGLEECVRRFG